MYSYSITNLNTAIGHKIFIVIVQHELLAIQYAQNFTAMNISSCHTPINHLKSCQCEQS